MGGAVDAIRGPEGTFVLLTLRRGEATLEVRVPRRLVRG
jgi:C-terminal processing protease CtpA/Prc